MRYSFCWRYEVSELFEFSEDIKRGDWPDAAYVVFPMDPSVCAKNLDTATLHPEMPRSERPAMHGPAIAVRGRVDKDTCHGAGYDPYIDITASRFTWQSITGLVVGAIGVFVFAVYLREWVNQRRSDLNRPAR